MLNFCVFTFILYAVAGSVKTILFGNRQKQRRTTVAYGRRQASAKPVVRPKKSGNITTINLRHTTKKRPEPSGRFLVRDSGTVCLETAVARVEHFSNSNAGYSFTPAGINLRLPQLLSGTKNLW